MNENDWVLDSLNWALDTWNEKLYEIWQLLTESPETFRGGGVWQVMLNVNGALKAISYGLLVLFFAVGVVKTCGSFADLKRPGQAVRLFVRFVLAKASVDYDLNLMMAVFKIAQGIVSEVITRSGISGASGVMLPAEIVEMVEGLSFLESLPLWIVALLGGLLITVLSFVMILTVYAWCSCFGTRYFV